MDSEQDLRGENVIIFSSDDWASGLKTSKYHIARQLARRNNVLFVDSVGLRAPSATSSDLGRVFRKLKATLRGARAVPEGLHVYTPVVVPFLRTTTPVKLLNGLILRLSLRWLQLRLRLSRPVSFVFIPTFNDVVGRLGERAVVYYCIDDLRGYAGVDPAWFDAEERTLLSRSVCVISSAAELHETFKKNGWNSFYVPHGVDWGLFRSAVEEDLPLPDDLRGIPEPRLGFYGFLSDEWVDYALLKRMAAERPDWHIVLIGRPRSGMNMEELIPEPNIHWLGMKPFESLPAYTRHFAVGMIPFRLNHLTRHSNPLKLLEYLAGGLPVVTTDIPETHRYADAVGISRTHDEFIDLCEEALALGAPALRRARSDLARGHSWEDRMHVIGGIVRTEMARRGD